MRSLRLLLLWVGLGAVGCSYGLGEECDEPPPMVIGSRVELARTTGGDEPRIGVPQSVFVSWHVRWSAGQVNPQDFGEPCVEVEEEEKHVSEFEVIEAECLDGACEVISTGSVMLFQQMREVRVSLTKPTATLRVRLRASSGEFRPPVPDVEGEVELWAE